MENIFSVTALNQQIRRLLEFEVGSVCVQGEISNFSQPASGHFYFTLKDEGGQLRCVFFRNRHGVNQILQNGQKIVARGTLSIYEPRGDYQLMVTSVDEAGIGDLHQLFEALKRKLSALGLFDASRKKPLPRFPSAIGVVTSSSGAALQDILTTLNRRFPNALVLVYPCDVQGKTAAAQLVSALYQANLDARCDVIILARGGGSIEDLWAFNEEQLAHAVAASRIPVVSGVGHETDVTIVDFVADYRAATPTAAAEAVTPDCREWLSYFQMISQRLLLLVRRILQHQQLALQHRMQWLSAPDRMIATYWQKIDMLGLRLQTAMQQSIAQRYQHYQNMTRQLTAQNPRLRLTHIAMQLQTFESRCLKAIEQRFLQCQQRFQSQLTVLHALSPLATLDRGYALVMREHHVLMRYDDVSEGDEVEVRLSKGTLRCVVSETNESF